MVFWLHGQSNFVRWLQRPAEELTVRLGRGPRVPLEDRRLLYDELRRLCSENGVRLVVAVPIYREFDRHAALLRELSAAGEFEVVDLPAMLEFERETATDRRALFFDKVHPRAELHQRIGVAITGFLAASDAAAGLER